MRCCVESGIASNPVCRFHQIIRVDYLLILDRKRPQPSRSTCLPWSGKKRICVSSIVDVFGSAFSNRVLEQLYA